MTVIPLHLYLTALGFWMTQQSSSFLLPNATELLSPAGGRATGLLWGVGVPRSRRKRYLSPHDMSVILDYHNQVRAQVSPPAANMEYMVSWALAGCFVGPQLLAAVVGLGGSPAMWVPSLVGTRHPHIGMSGCCPGFAAAHLSWGMFRVPGAGQTHARPMRPLHRRDGVPVGGYFHPGEDLGPLVPCLGHLRACRLQHGRIHPAELR